MPNPEHRAAATAADQPPAAAGASTAPVVPVGEFLTIAEAAAILGKRKSWVYELARTGKLPAIRMGRSVRVSRPALDRLHQQAAAAAAAVLADSTLAGTDSADRLAVSVEQIVYAATVRGVNRALAQTFGPLHAQATAATTAAA